MCFEIAVGGGGAAAGDGYEGKGFFRMYLAYPDESGDSGVERSPTRFFVLNCILIHESHWLEVLESFVDLIRHLRTDHKLPFREEIKAPFVRRSGGAIRDLR